MPRQDEQRQRIIEAARTIIGQSGLEGLKVRLVLQEAGVSARTFYREFANKDELLLALLQEETARTTLRVRAAVERACDPVEKVAAWIGSVIGAAADSNVVAQTRLLDSLRLARRYRQRAAPATDDLSQPLLEAITEGHQAGVFPWSAPARDTMLVSELTGELLSDALARSSTQPLETVIQEATGFANRALGVPPGELSPPRHPGPTAPPNK
jgi:AcrR family transcriptional regulator